MTDLNIDQRVIKCICAMLDLEQIEVTPSKKLEEDLFCDSLDKLEIIMGIESEFQLEIDDSSVEKIATVQDIIDLIARLQIEGATA